MGKQRILSSKFNISLGYIPVIISIILCEFIIQDIAIYIGAGVGVLSSIYMWQRKGPHIPQFILYSTTGMLLLLTITSFFSADYCPEAMFPFTLEISAIIPPLIIFLNRRRFLSYHTAQTHKCCKQFFAQGAEAAIVSARVLLLIGFLHFLIISLAILFGHPLNDTLRYILFRIMPPCVFILGILFNQFGIYYFNKIMSHTVFVPIVTKKWRCYWKSNALRSHQPEKRIYQSRYPHHRNFTRYAVFTAPSSMQHTRKRQNGYINGELLIVWRNSGTRC